jgi:hypothetical protein
MVIEGRQSADEPMIRLLCRRRRSLLPMVGLCAAMLGGCSAGGSSTKPISTQVAVQRATPTPASSPVIAAPRIASPRATPPQLSGSPTQMGAVPPCPLSQEARSFAAQLAGEVTAVQSDAVVARLVPQSYTCPGPATTAGEPFPLCTAAGVGEQRQGYPVGHPDAIPEALSADQFQTFLHDWVTRADAMQQDGYGTGAVRLNTVGCPGDEAATDPPCQAEFDLVFSELCSPTAGAAPARSELILSARVDDSGRWVVGNTVTGVFQPSWLQAMLMGGNLGFGTAGLPETFFPWT